MQVNLIGTQGIREYALKGGHSAIPIDSRIVFSSGINPWTARLSSTLAYYFAEYVWSPVILFLTVSTLASRFLFGTIRLYHLDRQTIKRVIDIAGSLSGLLLTAPLFMLLPILIKLDSPGPIFYWQLRVGQNRRFGQRRAAESSNLGRSPRDRRRTDLLGRPFYVIKFRTMVPEAEKKCGAVWATRNDPRVTRLGRLMRKTRMDEIPQFINILRGQMSLVGPRPERPKFVEELSSQVENYTRRLEVKPGLTGLAQVEHGYDSSIASVVKKVQYDLQYIQKWSLRQDFKIMLRTVLVVITGRGAC